MIVCRVYLQTAAVWTQYLRNKTDFFQHVKKLPKYINKTEKELMTYIGGLYVRHCIQLHTNVIPVRFIDNKYSYVMNTTAVCPSASIMKHSCMPNTAHYFINDVLIVKAIVDINVNEEISRLYTSAAYTHTNIHLRYADEPERKKYLKRLCFLDYMQSVY